MAKKKGKLKESKPSIAITTPTPGKLEALRNEELRPGPETPVVEPAEQPKQEDNLEDPKALDDFVTQISTRVRTIIQNSESFAKKKVNPFSFLAGNQHRLSFDEAIDALDQFIAGKAPEPTDGNPPRPISTEPEILHYLQSWSNLMAKRIDNLSRPKEE